MANFTLLAEEMLKKTKFNGLWSRKGEVFLFGKNFKVVLLLKVILTLSTILHRIL